VRQRGAWAVQEHLAASPLVAACTVIRMDFATWLNGASVGATIVTLGFVIWSWLRQRADRVNRKRIESQLRDLLAKPVKGLYFRASSIVTDGTSRVSRLRAAPDVLTATVRSVATQR
jgi:hypothetical protein